jgi:hypothetical protein
MTPCFGVENTMRRISLLCAVFALACAPMPERGEQAVTLQVGMRPDAVVQRLPAALRDAGFDVSVTQATTVVTGTKPIPSGVASTAVREGGAPATEWFLHVSTFAPPFMGGSRMEVRAYLVPPPEFSAGGNVISQPAVPVTSRNTDLYNELQRIARQLQESVRASN